MLRRPGWERLGLYKEHHTGAVPVPWRTTLSPGAFSYLSVRLFLPTVLSPLLPASSGVPTDGSCQAPGMSHSGRVPWEGSQYHTVTTGRGNTVLNSLKTAASNSMLESIATLSLSFSAQDSVLGAVLGSEGGRGCRWQAVLLWDSAEQGEASLAP